MPPYRKGLVLSLGPIQALINLETVVQTKPSPVRRLCPDHHVPLKQAYRCPTDHDVPWGAWDEGIKNGTTWTIVDKTARPTFDADDVLTLVPVPAADLEGSTLAEGSLYYCSVGHPSGGVAWQLLHRIVRNRKIALVARGALRSNSPTRKLWRLDLFRDTLVLREIAFPDAIKDTPEPPNDKIDKATAKLVDDFIANLLTEWSGFDTDNDQQARMEAWAATGHSVDIPTEPEPTSGTVDDLQAALREAMTEAMK